MATTRHGMEVGWSGACAVAVLLATSAAAQVPEAVLLMDAEAARSASGRVAEVVRAQMMRIHRVVPGPDAMDLARREPACEGENGLKPLIDRVRAGSDLFFERTDLDGAAQALGEAVAPFFEHPCAARGDEAALGEVCAGAALLVRLHLLRGRTREAEDIARRVANLFPAGMVEETHEPPEVLALISAARDEGREVEVAVTPADRAAGARLLVNGVLGHGDAPWRVRLSPGGRHELAVLTASGAAYVWEGVAAGRGIRLDLDLADRVVPGPKDSLRLAEGVDPGVDGTATARRLAEVTGRTVLFARAGTDGWVRVEEATAGRDATRELLRLKAGPEPGSGIEVVVEPGGPLLSRPAWPWPYVAAGVAAGLLGAGVYLNVAANRDADAVNRGSGNRVGDYRTHRNWAIACYALAGASGAAAVLLAFLKPEPRDRFVVFGAPAAGGGFVSLGSRF